MKTPLSCHLYLTTLDITNHLDGCDSMENCETELAIAHIFQGSVGTRPAGATKV